MNSNIVIELAREIARVRSLLEKFEPQKRREAERTIRFAELAQQQCDIGSMYEFFDDLRGIQP